MALATTIKKKFDPVWIVAPGLINFWRNKMKKWPRCWDSARRLLNIIVQNIDEILQFSFDHYNVKKIVVFWKNMNFKTHLSLGWFIYEIVVSLLSNVWISFVWLCSRRQVSQTKLIQTLLPKYVMHGAIVPTWIESLMITDKSCRR